MSIDPAAGAAIQEVENRNTSATWPPSALREFASVVSRLQRGTPLVLLDYDGTLTPIVATPEQALLSSDMRETVAALSHVLNVAVVSGRDLADVKALVGLEGLCYAGSHGFEIECPEMGKMELGGAVHGLADLDRAHDSLRARLSKVSGVLIERKRFALAIHYRLVEEAHIDAVTSAVSQVASAFAGLELTTGKKVYELRPAIDWNKGRAVDWIAKKVLGSRERAVPLYIGDDVTDEDAFAEVKGWGVGVLVGDHGGPTEAGYSLDSTDQVREFLRQLCERYRQAEPDTAGGESQ